MKFIVQYFQFVCFVLFAVVLVEPQESKRPNFRNDYRYEKSFRAFYKLHPQGENWHKAKIICEAEGTELMVPGTLDEADIIPVLIMNIQNQYNGTFLGIHDLYSENMFVTINGGHVLNTLLDLFWEQIEPRQGAGRCVAMRRSGHLYVHPCDQRLPFLCKIKEEKVVFNEECYSYNLNWTKGPNDTCYMTGVEPLTWYDAFSTCLSGGGHLAILNNRAEAEYIRNLFKEVDERRAITKDFAFLGFSDLFQRHQYRTVHGETLAVAGYTDWDLKCNRGNKDAANSRHCGGIHRSGLLTTSNCLVPAMFFCEKSVKPSPRSDTKEYYNMSIVKRSRKRTKYLSSKCIKSLESL